MTPAEAVRAAFCAVLCVPEVADDDDLFALGGDSLAFVEVLMDVEETLGMDEIPDALAAPMLHGRRCTVAGLVAAVEQVTR